MTRAPRMILRAAAASAYKTVWRQEARPMQAHDGPSAVAQAKRDQTDHKKEGNLVGNDVIDIMANYDHASQCQFGQREPALCGRQVWDGISFAKRRPVAVIDRLGQFCFSSECFQQVSLWAMPATFGIAGRTREQIAWSTSPARNPRSAPLARSTSPGHLCHREADSQTQVEARSQCRRHWGRPTIQRFAGELFSTQRTT